MLPAIGAPLLATGLLSTAPSPDPAQRASVAEALVAEPLLSTRGIVVTSSEVASRAGARMLAEGGNAVDAAVAAAFALSAADPSESGLGGETWLLLQPVGRSAVAIACQARVPKKADAATLRASLDLRGQGGHATAAAPTTVATLARALSRYGTKSFADVLAPAIEEAERGWTVGWYEASVYGAVAPKLTLSPLLGPALYPGACGPSGWPAPVVAGDRVRLPALARTLRRLAEAGPGDFYTGRIASEIEEDMRLNGGFVTRSDLAVVPGLVREEEPIRAPYRDREILAVGATTGGRVLLETMQVLAAFPPVAAKSGATADAAQLLLDAIRIAREEVRAPRGARTAATPFGLPGAGAASASRRAREIRLGVAWNAASIATPPPPAGKTGGTTQVSVVDALGNAVSLTQTLGDDWGSGAATESLGFPYNSALRGLRLDDPSDPSYLRPDASLHAPAAPVIVLREGTVEMVLGSGGSSRTVPAIASVLRNVVDGGMSLTDAVSAPRVLWQDEPGARRLIAEVAPPVTKEVLLELRRRGYVEQYVVAEPESALVSFGGVNSVRWNAAANAWEGVGDPRRRGVAAAPERAAPSR